MTEQQNPKRKSWLPITVAVLVVIAAGVYGLGKYYESRKIQEIREALAQVPDLTVDGINGSFFGRELTLTGIKGSVPVEGETATYSIEKAQATGLNPLAFTTDGVQLLAETLTLTGMAWAGPGYTASAASYSASDIRGDFRQIAITWSVALPGLIDMDREMVSRGLLKDSRAWREHAEILSPFFDAIGTLSLGRLRTEDDRFSITADGKTLDMVIESSELTDFNLKKMGPLSARGITVALNGDDFVIMEALSMAGAVLPPYAVIMGSSVTGPAPTLEELFGGYECTFDALHVQGLKLFPHPDVRNVPPFALKDLVFSMSFKDNEVTIASDLAGLEFERDVLSADEIPEEIVVLLPEQLVLAGQVNMAITEHDDDLFDMVLKPVSLSEETLGSFTLSLDGRDIADDEHSSDGTLASMKLVLVDDGASEIFFRAFDEGAEDDGVIMRAFAVGMLTEQGAAMPEPLKTLATHLAAFLEQPGSTFTLNLDPRAPLPLDGILERGMMDPDSLGLSSSVEKK